MSTESSDTFLVPEDAESLLGIPNLGFVPTIENKDLRLMRDARPFSPLVEALRWLRTNLRFVAEQPLRSLAITSAVPAEGKSTLVANLAMALALDGKRVLVVDTDLRRPRQHTLFGLTATPGLVDLLTGTHEISEVVQPSGIDNISVICVGVAPPNPTELLGSEKMASSLADLEKRYDTVLLDTSPFLAVADAMLVTSLAQGTLVVIGRGETKKINVQKTLQLLNRAKATTLGTVFNRVPGPEGGYYYSPTDDPKA
ncbi:CpsD/CapB family tyrosine-protein kinase [Armatimonas sp.]|uniref:CpsD/CapB family tyrosine-protein kinase n=1 Tax=Armatimonas sp. TaxID=1872638 RepID=UPI00286C8E17|nr:CpsD/CapB family tyrosine-protein kinase [Armatimonas sp.]